ncbi:MAG: PrsW family glutamic-type intramembrane protease [Candidatus Coproplasma sp.]
MTEKKSIFRRACAQIKCFFVQTFRRHTGKEYSELVTRGVLKSDDSFNRRYPWAYIRVFAAIIILFAVFLLIVRFTSNELFAPTIILLATLSFSLPFLLLLYEIYPRNDLSVIAVVLIMLIGGAASCVITQILYSFFHASNGWIAAVYAGVFEEFAKLVPTLIIIAALKNKQPLVGFIAGAAVGCGFSIVEDLGYIFLYSNDFTAVNLTSAITTFFERGISSFCTHIVWTALIGWAFSYFRHALVNPKFYGAVVFSTVLHFCWDMPLAEPWSTVVCALCAVAIYAAVIPVLYLGRRRIFSGGGESMTPEFFKADEQSLDKRTPEYYVHAGNLSLAIGAFLMAVVAIIYCAIPFREAYYTQSFSDAADFVDFMHDGYEFRIEPDRPFDRSPSADNVVREENDVVYQVVQNVKDGDATYHYTYNVAGDGTINLYFLTEVSVSVTTQTGEYQLFMENLYTGGKLYASFFRVRQDVTGFNFLSNGGISVIIHDATYVRDLTEPRYMALFYYFGGVAAAALILYLGFFVKSVSVKRKNSKEEAENQP